MLGRYETVGALRNDVLLIFDNCIAYNGADHPVSAQGERLKRIFLKLWNAFRMFGGLVWF